MVMNLIEGICAVNLVECRYCNFEKLGDR